MENTRRTWLTGLTTQGSRGFTETEAPSTGPEWFCTRSSAHILSLLAWCFLELLPVGVGISLTFLPALGIFFLLLGFLFWPWCKGFLLVFQCLVLSLLAVVLWMEACSFPKGNEGTVDVGNREGSWKQEVVDGEEIMMWLYCKRVESIF